MTTYEKAILNILSGAPEALGWYQIERRLSNVTLSERPHLPRALATLSGLGLVEEIRCDSEPKARYLITALGREVLTDAK